MGRRSNRIECGDRRNMVEECTLDAAAGSMVADPSDESNRVGTLLSDLQKPHRGGNGHLRAGARQDPAVTQTLQALLDLKAETLADLVANAQRAQTSGNDAARAAATLIIGMLRAGLTRRLAHGVPLTAEQRRLYEKIRVVR